MSIDALIKKIRETFKSNDRNVEEQQRFAPSSISTGIAHLKTDKTITLLGDSITKFCRFPSDNGVQYQGYDRRLAERIVFQAVHCQGHSGFSVARKKGYQTVQDKLAEIPPTDIYTIFLGINDFLYVKTPLGSMDDYIGRTGDATFFGGYRAIVDRLFELNPVARVLLCTFPKMNYRKLKTNAWDSLVEGRTAADFNAAIREIAEYESFPLIDLNRESGFGRQNIEQVTYDGLHPNDCGHRMIGDVFIKSLLPLI